MSLSAWLAVTVNETAHGKGPTGKALDQLASSGAVRHTSYWGSELGPNWGLETPSLGQWSTREKDSGAYVQPQRGQPQDRVGTAFRREVLSYLESQVGMKSADL